ncbi:hypothetical protein C8Q74DRAFT_122030 [Fomes fomentarius]|nr:hypothetical protein C8Q74DRAFT_122030 [Fomes fomentarius]
MNVRSQMGVRVVVDGRDHTGSRAVHVVSIALLALSQSLQHAHALPFRGSSEGMHILRPSTRPIIVRRVTWFALRNYQWPICSSCAIFEGYIQVLNMHAHEAFQMHRRTTFIAAITQSGEYVAARSFSRPWRYMAVRYRVLWRISYYDTSDAPPSQTVL